MTDWDDAYANAAHIPGGDRWPDAWVEPARRYRGAMAAAGRAMLDVAYGPGARNRYDLFTPEGVPRGLVVFVHGGYWAALDKNYWSHLAQGAVARGFAVSIPSYPLCPEARIAEIAAEVAAAVEHAAQSVAGPLLLVGHSAGGQLVTRLSATTSPLSAAIRGRLTRTVSISGLHDLRPLMFTRMNQTLRIDAAEAATESPALLDPLPKVAVTTWVGADERPEFIRQSRLLSEKWRHAKLEIEPDCHHFDVIDGLADPDHPIVAALTGIA